MAKILWQGSTAARTQNSNLTRYYNLGMGSICNGQSTESTIQQTVKSAGTMRNLALHVTAYSIDSGTCTFRTRKNTANGGMSFSFSATGYFEDNSGSDSLSTDDVVDYQIVTSGTSGSVSFRGMSVTFDATTDTVTRFCAYHGFSLSRNTTFYRPLTDGQSNSSSPTEAESQFKMLKAGTLKNLFVSVGSQNITEGTTFTSRIGGADGNLSVSITGTGTASDTDSDTVSAGTLVCWKIVTGTGSGSQNCRPDIIAVDYVTTDSSQPLVVSKPTGAANNVTVYHHIAGDLVASTTTEADIQEVVNYDGTASNLWVYLSAWSTSCTIDLRVDGSSSALTVSPSGTGAFEDTTHTVSLTAGQKINYRMAPGGSCTPRNIGMFITASASLSAKISAADASLTYTEITGKVTAADSEVTYTTIAGKVTAADAEVIYDIPGAQVTAADAEVTYTQVTGKVTASDAEVTYTPVTAQVTAADAEVTYAAVTAKITASDAEITYSETGAPTGKITAADAEITYTTVVGQVTAADAELTYTAVAARIVAADAEVTFTERGAQITASDAEITYSPVAGQISAADVEITHDTVVAKVTAADAEITFNERSAKITAADAEITYSIVSAGETARVTAVDIQITYTTTGPGWNWDVLRKVPDVWSAPAFPYGIVLQPNPSPPLTSQEQVKIGGAMSRWGGRNPFSRPGMPYDPLPIAGIIWYTYNNVDFTDFSTTSLMASPFDKGYNYDGFKQILVDRILARGGNPAAEIVETGPSVSLFGEVIIDLLSMLDLVIAGHWIPGYHCQQIKSRSTAPNGTKIVLWGNFQDINQSADWVPEANDYKDALAAYPLASTGGTNAYGCTSIDQFEANPWTTNTVGCPHTPKHNSLVWPAPQHTTHGINIDIYARTGGADLQSATTKELLDIYNAATIASGRKSGGTWYVDGFYFDTVLHRPLKGTSTLNFEASWTDARYVSSWQALFNGWHYWNSQLAHPYPSSINWLWGNLDDASMITYTTSEVRNRYLEWFFMKYPGPVPKTKTDIYNDLELFAQTGAHTILGLGSGADIGDIDYWATTSGGIDQTVNGNWVDVAVKCKQLAITNQTYALAFRTSGTGNYMMLQNVMRRPR